jgi:hypothetical protein
LKALGKHQKLEEDLQPGRRKNRNQDLIHPPKGVLGWGRKSHGNGKVSLLSAGFRRVSSPFHRLGCPGLECRVCLPLTRSRIMNPSEYSMTCSCGDEMKVDADSRKEAIMILQDMMTENAIISHMAEKHPGEPVPSVKEIHELISESLEIVAV